MKIELKAVCEFEFESIFTVVKQGLYAHVDAVFGWDDDFQRNRLRSDYQADWYYWIYSESNPVGLVCFKPYNNSLHLHLLIILPEHQNKKLGKATMLFLHDLAKSEGRQSITLYSFRKNEQAIKFYLKLGYKVTKTEENFLSLEWVNIL